MTPQERKRLLAMDDDTFARQVDLETTALLRTIGSMVEQMSRPYLQELVNVIGMPCYDDFAGTREHEAVKVDAEALTEAFNKMRASVSRFAEIAEAKIDQSGLIPLADMDDYDRVARSRDIRDIINRRS